MLPSSDDAEPAAAAALAAETDAVLDRIERVVLPPGDLDGWASLCAAEYRTAIGRLRTEVRRVDSALRAARTALAA